MRAIWYTKTLNRAPVLLIFANNSSNRQLQVNSGRITRTNVPWRTIGTSVYETCNTIRFSPKRLGSQLGSISRYYTSETTSPDYKYKYDSAVNILQKALESTTALETKVRDAERRKQELEDISNWYPRAIAKYDLRLQEFKNLESDFENMVVSLMEHSSSEARNLFHELQSYVTDREMFASKLKNLVQVVMEAIPLPRRREVEVFWRKLNKAYGYLDTAITNVNAAKSAEMNQDELYYLKEHLQDLQSQLEPLRQQIKEAEAQVQEAKVELETFTGKPIEIIAIKEDAVKEGSSRALTILALAVASALVLLVIMAVSSALEKLHNVTSPYVRSLVDWYYATRGQYRLDHTVYRMHKEDKAVYFPRLYLDQHMVKFLGREKPGILIIHGPQLHGKTTTIRRIMDGRKRVIYFQAKGETEEQFGEFIYNALGLSKTKLSRGTVLEVLELVLERSKKKNTGSFPILVIEDYQNLRWGQEKMSQLLSGTSRFVEKNLCHTVFSVRDINEFQRGINVPFNAARLLVGPFAYAEAKQFVKRGYFSTTYKLKYDLVWHFTETQVEEILRNIPWSPGMLQMVIDSINELAQPNLYSPLTSGYSSETLPDNPVIDVLKAFRELTGQKERPSKLQPITQEEFIEWVTPLEEQQTPYESNWDEMINAIWRNYEWLDPTTWFS